MKCGHLFNGIGGFALAAHWMGLVDITFSKWRNESLKALGNAIVPQVAYQIFKAIDEYEKSLRTPIL